MLVTRLMHAKLPMSRATWNVLECIDDGLCSNLQEGGIYCRVEDVRELGKKELCTLICLLMHFHWLSMVHPLCKGPEIAGAGIFSRPKPAEIESPAGRAHADMQISFFFWKRHASP
jgi:hypothetical protein